jgi:hypothetical protein
MERNEIFSIDEEIQDVLYILNEEVNVVFLVDDQ